MLQWRRKSSPTSREIDGTTWMCRHSKQWNRKKQSRTITIIGGEGGGEGVCNEKTRAKNGFNFNANGQMVNETKICNIRRNDQMTIISSIDTHTRAHRTVTRARTRRMTIQKQHTITLVGMDFRPCDSCTVVSVAVPRVLCIVLERSFWHCWLRHLTTNNRTLRIRCFVVLPPDQANPG